MAAAFAALFFVRDQAKPVFITEGISIVGKGENKNDQRL
jgi:hypothetical protein